MTNADDASPIPASPEPHRLSPRDESRVALALTLRQLADAVLDSVPVEPDPTPSDLLRTALKLQRRMDDVVREAVVAERERGTTWNQIGDAAGITRQSAHEKWYSDVHGPTSAPIGDDPLLIETHRGHADAVRANRLAIAAIHDEISALYDELTTAEPSLADEHHTQSTWHHNAATQARSYADLLNGGKS
ncbi:hypothetical protein [Streptomyces sp. NPDC101455]|uniref:hypothetical protein n=1 Tax=Streptomyces sp. NPDC101455 TaxID=3366142 RepID=UPI0037FA6658